jgi:hypothetical protein
MILKHCLTDFQIMRKNNLLDPYMFIIKSLRNFYKEKEENKCHKKELKLKLQKLNNKENN